MQQPIITNEGREIYGDEWFRAHALNSLKRIDDRSWDYSDSLLLYLPEGEKEYELIQEKSNPYSELITKPEMNYLEEIADEVVAELPETFEYIDLGPGTSHKEQYIFDAAKKAGKSFVYTPVDISAHYLGLSTRYAQSRGVAVNPLRVSFEDLPQLLKKSGTARFVSIGLTFGNYHPSNILPLLKSIAGSSGVAFINTQMRDRVDMNEVKKVYAEEASKVFDPKLELLQLHSDDISERVVDEGISVWYTLRSINPLLEEKGVRIGDKLLVFQSLRYTKDTLEKSLVQVFPNHLFLDRGGQFVGTLLKA
jgi:hypothetical protein